MSECESTSYLECAASYAFSYIRMRGGAFGLLRKGERSRG
jgi:hypothetical protein